MSMTSLHLKLLLHHYTHNEPWGGQASAFEEQLRAEGLLEITPPNIQGGPYRVTDKGEAHIQQLLDLPLPTLAWIDRDGQVIQRRS